MRTAHTAGWLAARWQAVTLAGRVGPRGPPRPSAAPLPGPGAKHPPSTAPGTTTCVVPNDPHFQHKRKSPHLEDKKENKLLSSVVLRLQRLQGLQALYADGRPAAEAPGRASWNENRLPGALADEVISWAGRCLGRCSTTGMCGSVAAARSRKGRRRRKSARRAVRLPCRGGAGRGSYFPRRSDAASRAAIYDTWAWAGGRDTVNRNRGPLES